MNDADLSKLSNEQLMALINPGQQASPAQPQAAPDIGYGAGVRAPDASSGRGVDVWVGNDQAPPASAGPRPQAQPQPPPQASPAAPSPAPQPAPRSDPLQAVTDRVRALARGVPVAGAFADEGNAALLAAVAPTLEPILRKSPALVQAILGYDPRAEIGNLPTFGARYRAAENLQKFEDQRFDQAHPKESMAEQVAGGLLGTVAGLPVLGAATAAAGPEAGLLARAGAGAVEGAGVGALHGYGSGYGDLQDPSRIKGAEAGALFGAGAGAALPVASQVAGTAWRATGGRMVDAIRGSAAVQQPATAEADRLATILRDGNPQASTMKPDRSDLESALVTAQRSPLVTRASNVDDAYVRIARAASRQKMTPEEVAKAARDVGPFGTLADTGEATRDLLRAAINRPGRGATIAQENLTPRQNGVFDPDTASWAVRPSSTRITDQAQAGLGLEGKDFHTEIDSLLAQRKAAAGPAYAKAYSAPPVASSDLAEFAGAPDFANAYGRARAISQKEFVKLPDGSEKIIPLPEKMPEQLDWRTLDLMKQGMQDTISEAKRQGIGANDQGATKGYLSRFIGKLDSLNPNYKAARDAFAGPTAMKDAIEEGRSLLSEDAPVVASTLAGKSEAERQMMRLGALQGLQTKLGNANVTFDAANQAGVLKPNQLARFKELFPDSQSFAEFYKTLQGERTMFGTSKAAFGNSTTAKQMLNVMEPSDPQLEGVTQAVAAGGTGNIIGLVRAIHRMGMESPMREGVAETIASVLSSHDAENLPGVVRKMAEAQRAAEIADVLRKSTGTGAGQIAGRFAQPGQ